MPRNQVRFLSILLLIAAIQAPLNAQLTAQLTGVIRDASGAIIPAASVTVLNEGTGIKWDASESGRHLHRAPSPARQLSRQRTGAGLSRRQPCRIPARSRANGSPRLYPRRWRGFRVHYRHRLGPAARLRE